MTTRDLNRMLILSEQVRDFPKIFRAQIGAMLICGNNTRIIEGNSDKSDPFQLKFSDHEEKIYPHAEINVIKKATKTFEEDDFKHASLYVCRLRVTGKGIEYAMAKPCPGCMRCIATFGIKKVFFSIDHGLDSMILV